MNGSLNNLLNRPLCFAAALCWLTGATLRCSLAADLVWSTPTAGLQVRLELVEKPRLHGTRWLVPYLQLRNVRDLGTPMEVQCDGRHLKVELVDKDGKVVRSGWLLPRSGPTPDPGTVILPWDSSMRISLECRNWGMPKNAPAMVSTDSGAWVIGEQERGKVFLRATLTGEKSKPRENRWHGEIQTPTVPVDWESPQNQ